MTSWDLMYRSLIASCRLRPPIATDANNEEQVRTTDELTAIDFYSGIGGNHYAFDAACASLGIKGKVAFCVEINDLANKTYKHNFKTTKVRQCSIESLKYAELLKCKADVWLASPPCQPFTRMGLQKGQEDPRTKSFYFLLNTLVSLPMNARPQMLFIENVRNFEISIPHDDLFSLLLTLGYSVKEFLLNPNHCGIPNSRLRYYLIAKKKKTPTGFGISTPLSNTAPSLRHKTVSLSDYLKNNGDCVDEYLLTQKDLCGTLTRLMDIIFPHSTGSMCFTKGYPQYVEGTGSMMCHNATTTAEVKAAITNHDECGCPAKQDPNALCDLLKLRIRRFDPNEIRQLLAFPDSFQFHPETSLRQKYRLLGNSVCVAVVSDILTHLLSW